MWASVKELERIAVNYAANAVLKDDPDCSAQDLSMLAEWETAVGDSSFDGTLRQRSRAEPGSCPGPEGAQCA
ncbi:hypothetical protein MYX04_06765 [Nitrospiraceae bacterium AH_259_D15_M11_P09]|nr:hypothetical protein [Nitrospiraceae bacterium AH_259_D15_M11_P09]